ncbi:MAG: hypothetical protein Q7T82_19870 [Armatimonadota bacterium]|nr:hypothetical protein [Armatimonadota bacterium]
MRCSFTDYFDYESVAREAGISPQDLAAICENMRLEFPTDDMMWELHVLRACMAIRDGHLTVQQAKRKAA